MKECYPVTFRKQVHSSFSGMDSEDVWLEYSVNLLMPPCIGLEVSFGNWYATITSLHVDLKKGKIEAFTESDKEIYNAMMNQEPARRTIREIVKEWTVAGWKVEKR